jgi:hypothetical protein
VKIIITITHNTHLKVEVDVVDTVTLKHMGNRSAKLVRNVLPRLIDDWMSRGETKNIQAYKNDGNRQYRRER